MVHRVNRMSEIFRCLEDNHFGIKKVQLIYPKSNGEAMMFLVEARKNKISDIKFLEPIYVYNENKYTEQVLKIFNFKKGQ